MAIHESNVIESTTGFKKEIDADSMHMIFDNVQKYQYQFPQKSTVRELAANAVDSIKERDIAKLIISGQAKEEDYYIRREYGEFKDSNFNADYFDLKWLSDKKEVEIVYTEGNRLTTKDRLSITDYGVGLGGKRLELYFRLSGSTKRNSKSAIGKFGIGAKAPLSTQVDSYRTVTCHNGRKFSFDVYSHKVDSITEKFNAGGTINPTYTFENGYTCYYEETTELNHTEISLETKPHHRSLYNDAVRQQLLYFDNVVYKVRDENGYESVKPTKASVIYEDDDIILSDNNQYSRPHIVIGKVAYGNINFLELELEDKQGNIGIKMDAESVDISPSRESIIWSDATRKAVTDKFNTVVEIASKEVEKQLNENDFVKWLDKCSRVLSYNDSYSILGRLSRVIDKSAIKPSYPLDRSIKYKSPRELLYGVSVREVISQHGDYNRRTGYYGPNKIVRNDLDSWSVLQSYKLYYTDGTANNLKDKYITHTQSGRFILVQIPELRDEQAFKDSHVPLINTLTTPLPLITIDQQWKEYLEGYNAKMKVINLIKASTESINYDELVVPEDFKKKLEESEVVDKEGNVTGEAISELTPAEKRKLDERTVLYYPEKLSYAQVTNKTLANGTVVNTNHRWIKHEPKISEVLDWAGDVIYAFDDEKELLLTVAWILDTQKLPFHYFTTDVKLVKISQGIKKYFKGHTHITEFFKKEVGGIVDNITGKVSKGLCMNNLFTKWYTGKRIADGLAGYDFLNNFSIFNQEIFDKYKELKEYQQANYKVFYTASNANYLGASKESFDAIVEYADSMADAQVELLKDPTASEYTKIEAMDIDKYNLLQEVIEYAKPLKGILQFVSPMTAAIGTTVNFELESEIKEIMRNKGYE